MFSRFFYPVKVNAALAAINISPSLINQEYRQGIQDVGYETGATPQEAAVFIAAQLPMMLQMNVSNEVIRLWIHTGKLDLSKPDVIVPLQKLGFYLDERP